MPRSGGVFSLVASYFATEATTIEVEQHNPVLEDIADALTESLPRDGSASMSGNLNANSNKVTNLAAGTASGDAVRYAQLSPLLGLAYTGDLQAISSAAGVYRVRLDTGFSNAWGGAAAGDFVTEYRADASNAVQEGWDADGTLWRNRESSGNWSGWRPFLNQNQVIGNDTTDLGDTQAIKLVCYALIDNGTGMGNFNVVYDEGCTVTRDSTGTYIVTFATERSDTEYMVSINGQSGNRSLAVSAKATATFTIQSRQVTTGDIADVDDGFSLQVYEKRS